MSIKYSDRHPPVKTEGSLSRRLPKIKTLIAFVLLGTVIVNVASMLPAPVPASHKAQQVSSAPTDSTLTFKAEADAQVQEHDPSTNLGTSTDLEVTRAEGSSVESYLRFTVSGLPESIQSARLRLYSTTDASNNGPALYGSDHTWSETEITWSNRPQRLGSEIDNKDAVRSYAWAEYDVTGIVTGDGTYSFVLAGDSSEVVRFSSREGSNGPQLIITFASSALTSTPPAPTPTQPSETANTLTITALADAHVAQASPSTNYGTAADLQVNNEPNAAQASFLRFSVSGINQSIHHVKLRLYAINGTQDGPAVRFADSSWAESGEEGITWDSQPTLLSGPVDNKDVIEQGAWVEYDVTAAVTNDGAYTFALVADSSDDVVFSSREGDHVPELVVTFGLGLPTPTSMPVRPGGVVLVGAGDIATCNRNPDELTAELLDTIPGTVFTVGDNAYVSGAYDEYMNCYEPSWGRHKARTKPIPGNHEYNTSDAAGYFQYFDTIDSYYAYDLGAWRIYALNSEIDVSAASQQIAWLKDDLEQNPRQCVLAYWHQPRWSSGSKNGSNPDMQTLWETFYEAGAELVINGHEHNYERFAEMDASGAAVAPGLREIVVGTGGAGLYPFGAVAPGSEVRDNSSFGVLKLTLYDTGYDWEFIPIPGSPFTDSGSGSCR